MIIIETITIDGREFTHTYSDTYIIRKVGRRNLYECDGRTGYQYKKTYHLKCRKPQGRHAPSTYHLGVELDDHRTGAENSARHEHGHSRTDGRASTTLPRVMPWKSETTTSQAAGCGNNQLLTAADAHKSLSDWTLMLHPLWTRISVEEFPQWVQPTGAQDAYMIGDK